MNLMEAVKARRSIRRYHATSINDDQLECLLSAAQWAPSAHNRQPWRFTPLRSLSAKEALADAMGGKLRADRRKDGDDERIISADVQRSRARIVEAPLVIVVSMSLSDMDQYKDELRSSAGKVMAIKVLRWPFKTFYWRRFYRAWRMDVRPLLPRHRGAHWDCQRIGKRRR